MPLQSSTRSESRRRRHLVVEVGEGAQSRARLLDIQNFGNKITQVIKYFFEFCKVLSFQASPKIKREAEGEGEGGGERGSAGRPPA